MKKNQINNNSINQIMLILIILLICVLIFTNLSYYLTGFLGAVTLYILYRKLYYNLTVKRGLNKPLMSIFFIIITIIFIVLPLWAMINYLTPQIINIFNNTDEIVKQFNLVKGYMSNKPLLKDVDLSDEGLLHLLQYFSKYLFIPYFNHYIFIPHENIC